MGKKSQRKTNSRSDEKQYKAKVHCGEPLHALHHPEESNPHTSQTYLDIIKSQ